MDALHLIAGFGLQVVGVFLLRRPFSDWRPWLLVAFVELANETSDLTVERWPDPWAQWKEAISDILLTLLFPTLLMIIARGRPVFRSISS